MPKPIPAPWFDDVTPNINDPDGILLKKIASMDSQSLGKNGSEFVSDTNLHSVGYSCLQIIGDTELTSLTGYRMTGYAGATFSDGHLIVGAIENFTLASGSVIAYLA